MEKVIIKSINAVDKEYNERENLEIIINGKSVMNFNYQNDCPEDNNMDRNFRDVFEIMGNLELVYNLGKNGVEVEFIEETINYEDLY